MTKVGVQLTKNPGRVRRNRIAVARTSLSRAYASDPERVKRFEARMAALANIRRRDREEARPKRWCILKTSPSLTLELSDTLSQSGYQTWTPMEIVKGRLGRSRAPANKLSAMMPTFVFADADRAIDLIRLSLTPRKPHADFSVFRYLDRVGVIADTELEKVRLAEQEAEKMRGGCRGNPFEKGAEIMVSPEAAGALGAFIGLPGVIEQSDYRATLVCFGGRFPVKIDTLQLREDIL